MGVGLAVHTATGQRWLRLEEEAAGRLCASWGVEMVLWPIAARLDRLLVRPTGRGWQAMALVEIKGRRLGLAQLMRWGSYMVSASKLEASLKAAQTLRLPFWLWVLLVESDLLLGWRLADEDGRQVLHFDVEHRQTQATCEGGIKSDRVALLPLGCSQILKEVS